MEKNVKRIEWLDISRGLAFLMVIYSHLEFANSTVMLFFGPVFLTTFFFVSGYLYKSNVSFSAVIEQRTRTLLIPLIVTSVIVIIMAQIMSFNEQQSLRESFLGIFLQNKRYGSLMWFVAALYVYSIFFYFVDKYCKSVASLMILGVIFFIVNTITYYILGFTEDKSYWYVHIMGFALFYMALGRAYRMSEEKIKKYFNSWFLLCALIIYIALILWLNKYISCGGSEYMIDAMVITLIGLYIIIGLSQHIKFQIGKRLIIFIGSNSLLYFAFHGKVFSLLQTIFHKGFSLYGCEYTIGANFGMDLAIALMITLLDALILIYPIKLINQYLPWMTGKGYKLWK